MQNVLLHLPFHCVEIQHELLIIPNPIHGALIHSLFHLGRYPFVPYHVRVPLLLRQRYTQQRSLDKNNQQQQIQNKNILHADNIARSIIADHSNTNDPTFHNVQSSSRTSIYTMLLLTRNEMELLHQLGLLKLISYDHTNEMQASHSVDSESTQFQAERPLHRSQTHNMQSSSKTTSFSCIMSNIFTSRNWRLLPTLKYSTSDTIYRFSPPKEQAVKSKGNTNNNNNNNNNDNSALKYSFLKHNHYTAFINRYKTQTSEGCHNKLSARIDDDQTLDISNQSKQQQQQDQLPNKHQCTQFCENCPYVQLTQYIASDNNQHIPIKSSPSTNTVQSNESITNQIENDDVLLSIPLPPNPAHSHSMYTLLNASHSAGQRQQQTNNIVQSAISSIQSQNLDATTTPQQQQRQDVNMTTLYQSNGLLNISETDIAVAWRVSKASHKKVLIVTPHHTKRNIDLFSSNNVHNDDEQIQTHNQHGERHRGTSHLTTEDDIDMIFMGLSLESPLSNDIMDDVSSCDDEIDEVYHDRIQDGNLIADFNCDQQSLHEQFLFYTTTPFKPVGRFPLSFGE